jgi:hypothetical protein
MMMMMKGVLVAILQITTTAMTITIVGLSAFLPTIQPVLYIKG